MMLTSSATSNGFKSAREVLDVKSSDGDATGMGSSQSTGRKRKRGATSFRPPLKRPHVDLTLRDEPDVNDAPDIQQSRQPPSRDQRVPLASLKRLPEPVHASADGWTTAGSVLRQAKQRSQPVHDTALRSGRPAAQTDADRYHPPSTTSNDYTPSPQQAEVLARIMKGESFFFTGSAGTGKSVLLRAIIEAFGKRREEYEKSGAQAQERRGGVSPWKLGVTASTGVSAINIGGSTLHSWAGIGVAVEPLEELTLKVLNYQAACDRWATSSALIVDEISMIDGKLLTKLDHIGKTIRKSSKPFGGLQLILCGDFFQLPPVSKEGDPPAVYAFESRAWKALFGPMNIAFLKQVFRQKDSADLRKMQGLRRALKFDDGIPAVELYPTKSDVNQLNSAKLRAIKLPSYTYESEDTAGRQLSGYPLSLDEARQVLDRQTLFLPEVTLKVGAVVMLLNNRTDSGLCNGSIGKVVDFMTLEEASQNGIDQIDMTISRYNVFPVVEFIPGKYVKVRTPKRVLVPAYDIHVNNPDGSRKATRVQLPLKLAWGLTVHKAQGLSLDRVKVDLARTFANGQAYVALSRATSMEGLQVLNFDESKLKVSREVIEWMLKMEAGT